MNGIHNPTDFSVFGIRYVVHDTKKRKKRVVIDIRGFKKITVIIFYPIPLQSNITTAITSCRYISVFDTAGFFHQRLVRLTGRHNFTVASHRGQKQFNVVVMGCKNFPFYVQKKIDVILRVYRDLTRVYVNDIIFFSHILEKHISYLHPVSNYLIHIK